MSDPDRSIDVLLWGATGFTGQFVAKYFAEHVGPRLPQLSWAIAGRDRGKLEQLASLEAEAEQRRRRGKRGDGCHVVSSFFLTSSERWPLRKRLIHTNLSCTWYRVGVGGDVGRTSSCFTLRKNICNISSLYSLKLRRTRSPLQAAVFC